MVCQLEASPCKINQLARTPFQITAAVAIASQLRFESVECSEMTGGLTEHKCSAGLFQQ